MTFELAILFGYLLGSIPFGFVLTRLAGKGDIRAVGSGNIGATNVLRTGSKPLAAAVLVFDTAKGTIAVLSINVWVGLEPALISGIAALAGHLFPIWILPGSSRNLVHGFSIVIAAIIAIAVMAHAPDLQSISMIILGLSALFAWGGKGVATGLGVFVGIAWPIGLVAGITWLGASALSRRSSVGALSAFLAAPLYCVFWKSTLITEFTVLVAMVVFIRHRENIARLIQGTEPKIGSGRKSLN